MKPFNAVILTSFTVYSLGFLTSCGSKSGSDKATPQISTENTQQENSETWSKSVNKNFANLDSATSFNLFLFGDLNQPSSDTEGSIAVGGNANLANYSIGDILSVDPTRYDLVVGGDLNYKSGSVTNGAAIVAGKINTGSTSFRGGVKHGSSPVNFAQAQKNLIAESQRLSKMSTNGKIQFEDWNQERGVLTLSGEENLNVFNIDADILRRTHTLNIQAPQNSHVLVNVSGKIVKIKSMGMTVTGTSRNSVLFNLVSAENLEISEISFEGSILAPLAKINFATGVVRGQIIAHSLSGSGQINHDPLDGEPHTPPTPEPPTPPTPPIPEDPEVPYL